ncbi:hypothetical protein AB0I22_01600 [Streptomyces sp. NPDC050610]|uniref:hypothetical protein n=1 Tax=Streptomyces sp. NPDC050610 TaxID=3157097 RepID=UPI003426F735
MEQHTTGEEPTGTTSPPPPPPVSLASPASSATPLSPEAATRALRDVEDARTRARFQARTVPAWYGPAAGAVIAIYIILAQRFLESGKVVIQLWVALPLAALAAFALRRIARRRRGVIPPDHEPSEAERWKRILTILLPSSVAACLLGGACAALGGSAHVAVAVLAVTLGLGFWAGFAWRNIAISRRLRETRQLRGTA